MSAEGTGHRLSASVEHEDADRFRAIFSQAAVGMALIGLDGAWLLVNHRLCEMLGYSEDELLENTWRDITHPDDRERTLTGRRSLLSGEISFHSMEKRYLRRDGSVMWGKLYRSLVRDQENRPRYVIGIVEDISDRKQAEIALRDSERRLSLAQNAARLLIWERDLQTEAVTTSGDHARLYGLTSNAPLKYSEWLGFVYPDDRERVGSVITAAVEQKSVLDVEFRVVWPDGSVHWLEVKGAVLSDDSGKAIRIVAINLEITDRKQAEAALSESEARFRNMADAAPVMIWVSGFDKLCTFFNKGWLTFTGRTMAEVLGNGWADDVHPDDRDRCYALYTSSFDARRNFQMEYRLRRADGEYRWLLDSGVPRFSPDGAFVGYIGSCIDISDMKRAQEESLARQKLESLGMLAKGIAHDFNNLLGSILAEAELAESDLAVGSSPAENIEIIKAIVVRASEIVRELMVYSGQDRPGQESVNLCSLVEEMVELLKVSISKNASIKTDLPLDVLPVKGNAAQLRQLVMNLVLNASEAIGDKGGVIRISASNVSDSAQREAGEKPARRSVRFEVSDTGCGMTEDVKAKIFDPFFTSKSAGRGLGLAVVQGIVGAHGGAIQVLSSPGRGASFEILLPCFFGSSLPVPSEKPSARKPLSDAQNRTILVVEDELPLQLAVSKVLRRKGLSVIGASDGSAAIETMQAHGGVIDLLLLDVTLPGRSSREVVEEAQRVRPEMKVIVTSAYGKEAVSASFESLPVYGFIRKPFHLDELMALLQDALASG